MPQNSTCQSLLHEIIDMTNLSYQELSVRTNISCITLRNIAAGKVKQAQKRTMNKLLKYFCMIYYQKQKNKSTLA